MLNPNVQSFLGCTCEYDEAKLVLYGAPFDSTTSFRPGARFGCSAIRAESFGLESFSPLQQKDLYDYSIFDSGDLELCIGESERALAQIEERARTIFDDGKLPVMLGGEHLVTLAAIRAAADKYPDLHILHFDAHTDLREEYLGARLSHASVMRRCWDILGDGRIHQYGIRSGERDEFEWAAQGHVETRLFDFTGLDECCKALASTPVYLSVDLDVMDPSAFPGTGTPEAGGVPFIQLLAAVIVACQNANVIGCDFVELCPVYDPSGVSTATAGKLLREALLALSQ